MLVFRRFHSVTWLIVFAVTRWCFMTVMFFCIAVMYVVNILLISLLLKCTEST